MLFFSTFIFLYALSGMFLKDTGHIGHVDIQRFGNAVYGKYADLRIATGQLILCITEAADIGCQKDPEGIMEICTDPAGDFCDI